MEARPALSTTQTAVLDAIRTSVRERGYPPTLREVGAAVGLASSSSVAHVIRVLEARGYLRCTPGSPRSLTIVDAPTSPPKYEWGTRCGSRVRNFGSLRAAAEHHAASHDNSRVIRRLIGSWEDYDADQG